MATATIYKTVTLVPIHCAECGITFGVPDYFKEGKLENQDDWYCPNGHKRHFIGETEAQKLGRQLQRERASHDQTRAEVNSQRTMKNAVRRQLSATKGVVTKTKNLLREGQCPCCDRVFKQLRKHMQRRHPTYAHDV